MTNRARRASLMCLFLAGSAVLTGCVSSAPRRQIVLVPVPKASIRQSTPVPAPPRRMLQLNGVRLPIASPPNSVRYGSARDRAVAAAYVAQSNPGPAVYLYRRLIEQHGRRHEAAFTRNAYHEALRCAWRAGDLALLKLVLHEYERSLDDFERQPEPLLVRGLRRFCRTTPQGLRSAYSRLNVRREAATYDVLQRDQAQWLTKHRDTVVALVVMVRDREPGSCDTELLDRLVLAEANLLNGYVRADSEILLFKDAEQRAKSSTRATDTTSLAIAVAQVFLERSCLVPPPGETNLLIGRDYLER